MRHGTGPVIVDTALNAWQELDVRLPDREVARALRSLTSREVLAGDQAYRFNVDLQRLWCAKHRHLDWVKDELTEAIQQWHESAQPRPADTIPRAAGPAPARAPGVSDDQKPQGAPAKARPRIVRNRYLVIFAAALILLLATAAARVFPFSTAQGPSAAEVRILTQNLIQLMPGDLSRNPQKCHSAAPSSPWTMRGLLLELQCTVPELPGTVHAYQLDNATDYKAAWQNFNRWWGFLPTRAGKGCPPKGTSNGIDIPTGSELPQANLPVTECGMQAPSPGKIVSAYAWGWPTHRAFVLARTASGFSFDALHSWSSSEPRVGLQKIIPADVQGGNNCQNTGTQYGATAVSRCSGLTGLAAGTIIYYLFPSPARLTSGLGLFLRNVGFHRERECMTGNQFTDFLIECQSDFRNLTPFMTGIIAEYTSTSHDPIIISTDDQQNVMAVMVGVNADDLLTYWNQFQWVVTGP